MKFLRNPEVLKTLAVYLILSVLSVGTAFFFETGLGYFVLILCFIFILIYFVSTYRRYRRIAALSADIDRLLHEDGHISLAEYSEGELAILQSEIQKLTVRLREQQQKLLNDKIYLADSIADISHQIKTPLTSINLLVSFLSAPELDDEKRIKYAHELFALLSRIEWLITALLKISKLDAGTVKFKKEKVALKELIKRSTESLLIPMELKDQVLSVEASGDFCGDLVWTAEALSNIVKNCMEHTSEGGTVSISGCENTLYTEIVVKDNGTGIDKEDLPHIFERFYKGKNSDEKSFGIGLALARMIVTSQNGTLKAENNSDCGAKFTIRFYKGTV